MERIMKILKAVRKTTIQVCTVLMLFCLLFPTASAAAELKGRAVWAGPRDAGTTEKSVVDFVNQLDSAHINTLILEFKGARGLCWPSTTFADAVAPEYRQFDMPGILIRECHRRGIKVHAWFIDYAEGAESYVVKQHPEWLALNPQGKPTTSEVLRGRPYQLAWMCPARRPGYTDQWLIPVILDFVKRYDIDAVHHDYIRYPGDLAPDIYCFCDYCLQHLPEYAGYYSKTYPDRPFYPPIDRPHLEAHWEKSPRVLPGNWNDLTREMKSRFLLQGSFFPGGNHDLDYFFYQYRIEAVCEFARQVFQAVRAVKPQMEISAAIFKNPVHSGRFIGQDWRRFADWVQYAMPMDYRSHFPGDFETFLDLLQESVESQKQWASRFQHLWIGVAVHDLFQEEREPLTTLRELLSSGRSTDEIKAVYEKISGRLPAYGPALAKTISDYLQDPKDRTAVQKELSVFLSNMPVGYLPPEKLLRTLERIKETSIEGIVIFSAGGIRSAQLWDAVGTFFSK
jgi:uncharacterized lipoprotein YddW (UPF0748 family)